MDLPVCSSFFEVTMNHFSYQFCDISHLPSWQVARSDSLQGHCLLFHALWLLGFTFSGVGAVGRYALFCSAGGCSELLRKDCWIGKQGEKRNCFSLPLHRNGDELDTEPTSCANSHPELYPVIQSMAILGQGSRL